MSKRVTRPKPRGARRASAEPRRSSRKARQAQTLRKRRRTRTAAVSAVVGVIAIVTVMVLLAVARHPATTLGSGSAGRAGELAQHVPVSVLDAVTVGQGITQLKALPSGTPPLEQRGQVEVLYIGAEYCPYCAAERWPLVVALSRFGTFSDLGGTQSTASDVFPRTQTFTFHGATYGSDVVAFVPVETQTNQPDPAGGYTTLEQPTAEQQALLQQYDRAPYTTQAGAIPFLMIGNRYMFIGASYDPSILQGMSRDRIAAALSDPASPVAQAVDGTAKMLTAAICQATDGKPSSVCSDPSISKIMDTLPTP